MDDRANVDGAMNPIIVGLIVFASIGLPSIVLWALPISQRIIGAMVMVATAGAILLLGRKMPLSWLTILVGAVALSSITALYWGAVIAVILIGYFAMSVVLVGSASGAEIRRAVELMSTILLALIVLGWIGLSYSLQGGEAIWEITTVGQPVHLYLTTFAVPSGTILIRPAGIFDEPGAFATFISLCAGCRILLGLPKGKTWGLLLGGLVTMSLALILIIPILGASELLERRRGPRVPLTRAGRRARMLAVVGGVAIVVVFAVKYGKEALIVGEFLLDRLQPSSESGRVVAGDSRSADFLASLERIDLRTFLFGLDASCFTDVARCYSRDDIGGTNPLAPLMMRGIFSQLLYYVILGVFLFRAARGPHRAAYLALALMYIQRPYVLTFGYSTWAVIALLIESKMRHSPPVVLHAAPVRLHPGTA